MLDTKSWYANCKMQNRIFQSSAKFMHGKIKKKFDTFTYMFSRNHCFNSLFKSSFQEAFLVKVIYTKKYTTCTKLSDISYLVKVTRT